MIEKMMRVACCGNKEVLTKQDGTQGAKRQLVLQEVGGYSRYDDPQKNIGNAVVATMYGNLAECVFYQNEIVWVSLRTSARLVNGQWYQDVTVAEIVKIKD